MSTTTEFEEKSKMLYFSIITVLIIAFDQLTKYLAIKFLASVGSVTVIPGIFDFTYVENRGAAFGMLANHRWIFMVLSVLGIGLLIFYYFKYKPESRILKTALIFICAGGCGNMIDRIFRGFVVDFINATFINFYVFNVADSFVCIGCAMFALYILLDSVKDRKTTKDTDKKEISSENDDKTNKDGAK